VWGNNPHTPKGTPIMGVKVPICLKSDCKGQNLMDWGVGYIIGNLLKFKCLKCAHMTHLGIWNTSYGQKKGWESNW
jgi:hypothetical protein